jgi:O-acetyl-ADP-ribose deacetylase (regulator of RNase III)
LYGESAAMGDFVETMDLILLSASMEEHLDHYKHGGVDGALGQQYFDDLEKKIIDRVGDDTTRGIHTRRGWATINETENAYVRASNVGGGVNG